MSLQDFKNYDFSKDEKFTEYLNGLEFSKYPVGFLMKKIQMKYYCRFVNQSIEYSHLLQMYLNEEKEKENARSSSNSSTSGSSASGSSSSGASSNPYASGSSNAYSNAYGHQGQTFVSNRINVNMFTQNDQLVIFVFQAFVLVLGAFTILLGDRVYSKFALLSCLANGLIAIRRTKPWYLAPLLDERGNYFILNLLLSFHSVSYIHLILMLHVAALDVVDFFPPSLESHPLYQRYMVKLIQWVNQNRLTTFDLRILLFEIVLYISLILKPNLVLTPAIFNLFIIRYIQSRNLSLLLNRLYELGEQYSRRVPFINKALLYCNKQLVTYVNIIRDALENLKRSR